MKKRFLIPALGITAAASAIAGHLLAQEPTTEISVTTPNTHEFSIGGVKASTQEEADYIAKIKCSSSAAFLQKSGHAGLRVGDIDPCITSVASGQTYKPVEVASYQKVKVKDLHKYQQ